MLCPNCKRSIRGNERCPHCGYDPADPAAAAALRARHASERARRRATWQRLYDGVDSLFHIDIRDFLAVLTMIGKWTLLGSAVGALAGTASAIFLFALAWATNIRVENPTLLFFLPVAGFAVGWLYHRFAGAAAQGNNLVIEEVNANAARIPFRMAPLVLLGTVVTHLFGGSAGREGTAIQMGASLADSLRRVLRLSPEDRRLIIMAGISGGFGSVFGTPVAGFVFGMEVQNVGRVRYDGIVPCLVAAYVGDIVTRLWGAAHTHYPALAHIEIDPLLLLRVAAAGALFGLTSILFVELTHAVKKVQSALIQYPPLRAAAGGVLIVALALALGTGDYLGLSVPLIERSVTGEGVPTFAFLLKLVFTAITLGSGFLGGEVTPLFVIGSTLGYALGAPLGADPAFMASIGFVAVFAGASNTPIACALMGIELFGGGSALYLILGCVIAYLASGHRGIYVTQRVGVPKFAGADVGDDESLRALAERRGGWLPALPGVPGGLAQRLVRSVMSSPAVAVKADAPLREALDLALSEGVRALPVLNASNQVVGILTDSDVRRAGMDANFTLLMRMTPQEREPLLRGAAGQSVRDAMSQPAITIPQLATLKQAIDLFESRQLKRLPVVDDARHLMGMITRSDILREIVALPEQAGHGDDGGFHWEVRVGEIALEPSSMITRDLPLPEIIGRMRRDGCKRLVVVDAEGGLLGIVTEQDVLERVANGERAGALDLLLGHSGGDAAAPSATTAVDLMTAPVIHVSAESSIPVALRLLIENGIKRLPVVDQAGRPVGLVGRAALIRALTSAEQAPPAASA